MGKTKAQNPMDLLLQIVMIKTLIDQMCSNTEFI